jgi:hypothetical protein
MANLRFSNSIGILAAGRTAVPLRQGISVSLPVTRNATPVPDADSEDSVIVAVTRDGGVYLELHQITESALTAAVRVGLSSQANSFTSRWMPVPRMQTWGRSSMRYAQHR